MTFTQPSLKAIIIPEKATPQKLKPVAKYRPNMVASRIGRQSGLFSVHPDTKIEIKEGLSSEDKLMVHTIKSKYKRQMLFDLNHHDIKKLTLIGELDGLSAHMCWTLENR